MTVLIEDLSSMCKSQYYRIKLVELNWKNNYSTRLYVTTFWQTFLRDYDTGQVVM